MDHFSAITGQGVSGTIEGTQYFIGSERLFTEKAIVYPHDPVNQLEAEGKTVILVGTADRAIGAIAVRDTVRSTSFGVLNALRKMNIKTVMLTGDNPRTAEVVAKQLGIDEYYAELLPENKVEIVKSLQQEYGSIAMVGDGVNDAPAVKGAHVGVAMGLKGTEVTQEASEMILIDDNYATIVNAIEEGRGIFETTKGFFRYMLSTNFDEIFLILIAYILSFRLLRTAILPKHCRERVCCPINLLGVSINCIQVSLVRKRKLF